MNEEGKNPLGFEVIDKRGRNNPIQEPPKLVEVRDEAPIQDRQWKSFGYVVVLNLFQGDQLVTGRSVGLDQNKDIFLADYIFGPGWEAGFDWTIPAKQRLDTFLRCQCGPRSGPCQFHRRMAPQGWMSEDFKRIRDEGDRPMPEAIEVLSRLEQSKRQATQVLAPRR